jgi:glycosyltransferase involved in cell wall biosynthesis
VSQPLVSVVTPFRNVAPYLAECIESVLAQDYSQFEYILSDNCSTDGSGEIAQDYARRDPRIRLVRQPQLLSQVQHYNSVLAQISDASQYCKIVQADDSIFPECLKSMVQAFEQSESIGLVSSYYLKGDTVYGSGFPYRTPLLPGKDMARLYLRTAVYVFGSPTTVMYRSSVVRNCQRFYDESLLHEDTEKCMQILEQWDFGFVHQVLSYLRLGNESISSVYRSFQPAALDWYIIVQRYAPIFFEDEEARTRRSENKQGYYRLLAQAALQFQESAFWKYQQEGLKTLGETLDWSYLALEIGRELLYMVANPGMTFMILINYLKRRFARRPAEEYQTLPEPRTKSAVGKMVR